MYVTRPLSQLLKSPESITAPPEGPNSGYLVIQDEESETYSCFGCCKNRSLKQLPFPQNKELIARYTQSSGESTSVSEKAALLIPVLNLPLSSNRYYAIVPHGKHKGEALTSSSEQDKTTCCFCRCIKDVKPRQLDPHNVYQQFEIAPYETCNTLRGGYFSATSIASDGFPPYVLRQQGWTISTKTPKNFKLDTAHGLDPTLRARLPELSSQPLVVGKWYSPFIFVKEGTLEDQVEQSMYYEVTLEQRWEKIFSCQRNTYENTVVVDTFVEKEEVFVDGNRAIWDEKNVADGVIRFTSYGTGGEQRGVGLRVELVKRMKWEQERGGFISGEERVMKITRVEECKESGWNEFGCYVLVERFDLRRMDGSLVLCYDFKHFHQIRTKWE